MLQFPFIFEIKIENSFIIYWIKENLKNEIIVLLIQLQNIRWKYPFTYQTYTLTHTHRHRKKTTKE